MQYINPPTIEEFTENLKKKFGDKFIVNSKCESGTWQTKRHIQVYPKGHDSDLHYEYRIDHNWDGRIELHFESDTEDKYNALIDNLINHTQNYEELSWSHWSYPNNNGYRCQHSKKIENIDDLCETMFFIIELFEELIAKSASSSAAVVRRNIDTDLPCIEDNKETVVIYEKRYGDIIRYPLSIPDYQRIYCWDEENVKCLLEDVFEHIENSNTQYRLGTIILHFNDGRYDIIDGQQRLVTLALLLSECGIDTGLLNERFTSKRSIEYVAYNKHIIQKYIQQHSNIRRSIDKLLSTLEFSVLVLQNASIDLAYTFFSNQNSRGVALTDYDLLKAHHLRYIPQAFEQQSKHAAEVWNRMIDEGRSEEENEPHYVSTLDTYIYRLRKWMRKMECDDSTGNYRIKKEYEAAPIIEEIAPFGENFHFNEPIQGGTHFFTYVERHINKYKAFCRTEEYNLIHNAMQGGSNQWYRDVIESILFGYFLKFGTYYLADALVVIMRILLDHRYTHGRAIKSSIVQYTGDTGLILIIDRSTSPTFFLAEARIIAKELQYPKWQSMSPIMRSLRSKAKAITEKLENRIVVESFKNLNR